MPSRELTQANATGYDNVIPPLRGKRKGSSSTTAVGSSFIEGESPVIVRLCSDAGNITLSGLQTIDGVYTAAGDWILVAAQTNKINNGIYAASADAWTRKATLRPAMPVYVSEGTNNQDTEWQFASDSVTVGTTLQTWEWIHKDRVTSGCPGVTVDQVNPKSNQITVWNLTSLNVNPDLLTSYTDIDNNWVVDHVNFEDLPTRDIQDTDLFVIENTANNLHYQESASELKTYITDGIIQLRNWVYNRQGTLVGDPSNYPYEIIDPLPDMRIYISHDVFNNATTTHDNLYLELQAKLSSTGSLLTDERELGTIVALGGTQTVDWTSENDWLDRMICVTAKYGQWFNVRHGESGPPATANESAVVTSIEHNTYGNDLHKLAKALFVAPDPRRNDRWWKLLSYERMPTWFKRYGLTTITYPTPYSWSVTNLPFEGYYQIDVRMPGQNIRTSTVCGTLFCPLGILTAAGSGDANSRILDEDSQFNWCTLAPEGWDGDIKGMSLQGSTIVYVTGNNCADRYILIVVQQYAPLPPETILSGSMGSLNEYDSYCNIEYLGETLGHDCNQTDI